MAISLDIQNSQYGVPFNGAYFRIATAMIGRSISTGPKFSVSIDVAGYITDTPDNHTKEIDFRRYHVPLEDIESQDGDTFLERCYLWVMSQEDMSGSTAI
jgi:hypothetical protein